MQTDFGDSKKLDPDDDPFKKLDEPDLVDDYEDRNSIFEDPLNDEERGTSR